MTSSLSKDQIADAKAAALAKFLKAHAPKKSKNADPLERDPVRITTLSDSTSVDVDVIPTGSLTLDNALGIGGFPKGRICELYGPTGSGKSTLALESAKICQDNGGIVGFIDAEQALNRELVNQIGIDPDRFVIAQTETAEQAGETCEAMVRSGIFDMIIIDSAAAMIPKQEFEADFEQNHMGLQARMLSKLMRKITGPVAQYNVALVIINQIRSNLQAYGAPEESTGGKALKFFSSVRVEVRTSASKQIKEGANVVGTVVTGTVKKNKFAAPFRKCEWTIKFGHGIDSAADVFNVGVDTGVIEKAGNTYTLRKSGPDLEPAEVKLGVGVGKASAALQEDPELFAMADAAVRATLRGTPEDEAPEEAETPQAPPASPLVEADEDDFFGLNG